MGGQGGLETYGRGPRRPRHPRSPTPSRLRPDYPRGPLGPLNVKLGYEWEREVRQHACARVRVRTHSTRQAKPRLSPNSRLGPAGAPGLPAPGQSCRGLSAGAEHVIAGSPQSPRPRLRPKGPLGLRGWLKWTPGPAFAAPAPPPLTCSTLCGSSGARQPWRRQTGCRRRSRRRLLRPAGSR